MKTATVFGSLSSNTDTDFSSVFDILKQYQITDVFIGGYYGHLKGFTAQCKERGIEVTLLITKKGKELGYGSSEAVKEVATEKYFEKKNLLYSSSDVFIFLPTQQIGLGLLAEIVDLLDYSITYCAIVKQEVPRIVFMGQTYKTVIENILTQTNNTLGKNIEYAN